MPLDQPTYPTTTGALVDHIAEAMAADKASDGPIVAQSSTALTLTASHLNTEILATTATTATVKIPLNLAGSSSTLIGVRQMGAGPVNITWDAGVTVVAPDGTQVKGQYARGQITRLGTNLYILERDLATSTAGSGGGVTAPPGGGVVPVPTGFLAANASSVSIPIRAAAAARSLRSLRGIPAQPRTFRARSRPQHRGG